jgi:hypothetical protein
MSIEINEMIVNATIADDSTARAGRHKEELVLGMEELKAQIISECRDLFYEMLIKQGDR